jgi:hypothetical protein
MSLDEVESLATVIAMSGGSLIFSDDLTALSRERFEMAARLLPPVPTRLGGVGLAGVPGSAFASGGSAGCLW